VSIDDNSALPMGLTCADRWTGSHESLHVELVELYVWVAPPYIPSSITTRVNGVLDAISKNPGERFPLLRHVSRRVRRRHARSASSLVAGGLVKWRRIAKAEKST
jgi:hypothetical protein